MHLKWRPMKSVAKGNIYWQNWLLRTYIANRICCCIYVCQRISFRPMNFVTICKCIQTNFVTVATNFVIVHICLPANLMMPVNIVTVRVCINKNFVTIHYTGMLTKLPYIHVLPMILVILHTYTCISKHSEIFFSIFCFIRISLQ